VRIVINGKLGDFHGLVCDLIPTTIRKAEEHKETRYSELNIKGLYEYRYILSL
jgi:hypothetical protein